MTPGVHHLRLRVLYAAGFGIKGFGCRAQGVEFRV